MNRRGTPEFLAAALVLAVAAGPILAQEWKSDLAVDYWGNGFSGGVGVADNRVPIHNSFSDILGDLSTGWAASYAGGRGRWGLLVNGATTSLADRQLFAGGLLRGDVDVDLSTIAAEVGYALGKNFQIYGGARWVDVSSKVTVESATRSTRRDGGESWADPVVGVRCASGPDSRFVWLLQTDYAGFHTGSDMTWTAEAAIGYGFNESFQMHLGYRWLDVLYEKGSDADYFVFDGRVEGPYAGVGFSF